MFYISENSLIWLFLLSDTLSKDKIQFFSEDFIYFNKGLSDTNMAFVEKVFTFVVTRSTNLANLIETWVQKG